MTTFNSVIASVFVAAFNLAVGQNDSIKENQRAFYECSEPMMIDSAKNRLAVNKVYFQFNVNEKAEKLKKLNFIWLENNPEDYFVAYLLNTTDSIFQAKRQDGSLIMIQEALDENGNWQPIEYWVYSGCGNSYFDPLQLEPGKCVLVPIKKYSGNFTTKIRLKFKYGNSVMYSESFNGSIDKAQFNKKTDSVSGILYFGPANYLE